MPNINNKQCLSNKASYQYILRFTIQPGFNEEERFLHLLDFCKTAAIDEVMFFINCEELNQGHLTLDETEPWMRVIERGKELLEPLGIRTSINPWTTMLHTDRGRKLKEGQDFRLMIDPYGNMASAVACPLCTNWQEYISEMYSYYATLKPNVIWVEDDFRLHNHSPLIWGGCFCDHHMEEYLRFVQQLGIKEKGEKLTREEFVKGIYQVGEVHPYRKIWLDVSRQTMINLANLLGNAVHKVSPTTKVGLMSSGPSVHCAEGRDWDAIFKGFSGNTPPVSRPHLPSYNEVTPQNYILGFSAVSRMTKEFLPQNTEVYPELESFQHTRFSKSKAFTSFQIETSTLIDSKGITFNIFDMMGNGVLLTEGYQYALADTKAFVNKLTELGLDTSKQEGVKIPICQESSYTLRTKRGNSMDELYPREEFWAQLLSAYGVANTYTCERKHLNSIVAVSGQYFRNLSYEELRDLFSNNYVIMEGEAAYTLWDMGYGHLAGIIDIQWHKAHSGVQSYEETCNGEIYSGIRNSRMSSQGSIGPYLAIKYNIDKYLNKITEVKNAEGDIVGPGMANYNNKIFILPYCASEGGFGAYLNTTRQEIIQSLISKMEGSIRPTIVLDAPYVSIYDYAFEDKRVLVVVNASGDNLDEVKISLPGIAYDKTDIYEINKSRSDITKALVTLEDGIMTFKGLKRLEVKAFVLKR
jgi:hypothetical protein